MTYCLRSYLASARTSYVLVRAGDEGTYTNRLLSKIASFNFQTLEQRPSLLRHPNFECVCVKLGHESLGTC